VGEGSNGTPGIPGGLSRARLADLNVRPEGWAWFGRQYPPVPEGGRVTPFWEGAGAIGLSIFAVLGFFAGLGAAAWMCAGVVAAWAILRFRVPGSARARAAELTAAPGRSYGGGRISLDARDAVDLLLRIPGTAIFHDVHLPGVDSLAVSHVVVNGSRVVLLDSTVTADGVFRWAPGSPARVVNTVDGSVRVMHLREACAGFGAWLGTAEVYGAVMLMGVHSSVTGPVASGDLQLGRVDDVLGCVGDFLAADLHGDGRASARIRGLLYGNLS